jgi:hypothetical protein
MTTSYRVIVSSENSIYMGWQTQLFCYSAISRLGKYPTVIIHNSSDPIVQEFRLLEQCGCRIVEAPSYRTHPIREYPPRNEVGSLLTASILTDIDEPAILFCEPDMIFTERLEGNTELSGEYYSYLDYRENRVRRLIAKYSGSTAVDVLNESYKIGVPYSIPMKDAQRIAIKWMEVLDSFDELGWIDIMYAFGIAIMLNGLRIQTTRFMDHNQEPQRKVQRHVVHYCYGDTIWDKRNFGQENPLKFGDESFPPCDPQSILGEIVAQIREARKFYYGA